MKFDKRQLLLYAVTDRRWLCGGSLYGQVEQALRGGVSMVQLREKSLSEAALLAQAQALKPLCARYGVPLILNDHLAVAAQVNADGVHLGQQDTPVALARQRLGTGKIIGASAHTVGQAQAAQRQGADYLGVGAVFATDTKQDAQSVDYHTLQAICQAVQIPVVAIGGITLDNLSQLAGSGICGVALVSAIFASANITEASRALRQQVAGIVPGATGDKR